MSKSIAVGAVLCCAHRDTGSGQLHGHTYEIVAHFRAGQDARQLQATLQNALWAYDHSCLPDDLARAEDLAEQIAVIIDDTACLAIEVNRPLERIYARWDR